VPQPGCNLRRSHFLLPAIFRSQIVTSNVGWHDGHPGRQQIPKLHWADFLVGYGQVGVLDFSFKFTIAGLNLCDCSALNSENDSFEAH
jgi:hypothetical protein